MNPNEARAVSAVVELRGIGKTFGAGTPTEQHVLSAIDFTLRAGEFCALTGPSGSGKSTLLNLIGLLDRPSLGRYL